MSTNQRLQSLDVWVNARKFVRTIHLLVSKASWNDDYAYRNQLRSASVSIMSNIAEGFGRSTDRDFARFLDIARGSALEVQSLIFVGLDVEYIDQAAFDDLMENIDHVIAQITSLARHLRNK